MKRILLLLLSFLVFEFASFADHFSGAEITYECLGPGTGAGTHDYQITLAVYRDCSGQFYQGSYIVNYNSSCNGSSQNLELFASGNTEIINDQLCPGRTTRCSDVNSVIPGIERQLYTATVNLPDCNNYKFWWIRDARNDVNLSNVTSNTQLMFVDTEFDVNSNCNSSPMILGGSSNLMSRIICAGEYFSFPFGNYTQQTDGDSLSYELYNPEIDESGTNLLYESGFNYLNPITATGLNLDPVTGLLEFTSGVAQQSIISIKITEYDNAGNEIGYIIRDMNIIVENCTNNAPEITGINGTQEDTIYMCGGQTTCFFVYVNDVDGDNLTLTSIDNQGISGMSNPAELQNNTPGANYRFCFNPDTTGVYTFDLGVHDNHCPDTLRDTRTITIIVPNDTVFQCECASVDFDYDNICLGSTTTFTGNPTFSLGSVATSWSWEFGDGATGAGQTPTHTYSSAGDYDVTVSFTDDAGCTKTSTSTLHICDVPDVGFVRYDSCQVAAATPTPILFEDTTTSECSIFQWEWDFGNGVTIPFNSTPAFSAGSTSNLYPDSGWFNVSLSIEYGDANAATKCYTSTNKDLYVYPKPQFTIQPDNFYQSCDPTYDTLYWITLADTSQDIEWYLNGALIPVEEGGENDSVVIHTEYLTNDTFRIQNITVRVRVEDSLGCYEDSNRFIYDPIHPRFIYSPYCEPGDSIVFWDITDTNSPSAFEYGLLFRYWDFGDSNSSIDTSLLQMTEWTYSVEDIYTANLYIMDQDSCYDWAARPNVNVVLPDDGFSVYASGDPTRNNDTICFGNQSVVFEGPGEDRASINQYLWEVDDTTRYDSIIFDNRYNGTWTRTYWLNGSLVGSPVVVNSPNFTYNYDSAFVGTKNIHLKMIYNMSRDDRGALIDSLYCVRHYFDTIDIRPPQQIDWFTENRCVYQTNELTSTQLAGDSITSWFVDFGDECTVCNPDIIWSIADTFVFGGVDSVFAAYSYTDFSLPDRQGLRRKQIILNDVYGCISTFNLPYDTVIKVDTQAILPLNYCDNQTIFFPPNGKKIDASGNPIIRWANDFQNIIELHWDFGVPGTDTDTLLMTLSNNLSDSITYFFPDDTIYNITLTAYTENRECSTRITKQLAIQPAPIASLAIPGISCVGSPVEFVDNSITRDIWVLDGAGGFERAEDTLTTWILYIDGDTINMSDSITTVNGDTVDMGSFADGGFPYTYGSSYYDTVILVAITDTGCFSSDTIFPVYTAPYPIANFGCIPDLPGPRSELVFVDSTDWIEEGIQHPDSSHFWIMTNDDGEFVFSDVGFDLDEIVYAIESEDIFTMQLIVQNEYRCTDTISKEIDSYSYLDFPTAFSPTEDGAVENNIFRLHHKGFKELLEYRIFNRYGEVVFLGQDLNDIWDGKYKGRLQETGMYVVVVRAVDVLDREKQLRKNVLLVR